MPSCETATCSFCGRRAIRIDPNTDRRRVHRVRTGRKGPQCAGSGRHRDSVPEPKKLGVSLKGFWVDEACQ